MSSNSQPHRWPLWRRVAAMIAVFAFGWITSTAVRSLGGEGGGDEPGDTGATVPVSEGGGGFGGTGPAGPASEIPGAADPLLLGGSVVPLDEAAALASYPISMPSDSLASSSSLTQVWIQRETGEVALRFSTGIRIYFAEWPAGKDPAESLEQQASDAGAGWIDAVAGHPVWVLPMNAGGDGFPPQANVTLVVGGAEVNIWGDAPTDGLLRVASSLAK
jgi:hypothetical protein